MLSSGYPFGFRENTGHRAINLSVMKINSISIKIKWCHKEWYTKICESVHKRLQALIKLACAREYL